MFYELIQMVDNLYMSTNLASKQDEKQFLKDIADIRNQIFYIEELLEDKGVTL